MVAPAATIMLITPILKHFLNNPTQHESMNSAKNTTADTTASIVNVDQDEESSESSAAESLVSTEETGDIIKNENNSLPPARDLRYWWITLVCVVFGVLGPLVYYAESLTPVDSGRYVQGVTCAMNLILGYRLYLWSRYDVEVHSVVGFVVLWIWLFYGVVEVGRVLARSYLSFVLAVVHQAVVIVWIRYKGRIRGTGWQDLLVWGTVVVCFAVPVNLPSKLLMREGVVYAYLFMYLWYLEMFFQGVVKRDIMIQDIFLKTVPVLRADLWVSCLYVSCFTVTRIYRFLGHQGVIYYEPPRPLKTPMSLYKGVEVMFVKEEEEEKRPQEEEKPGLSSRKRVAVVPQEVIVPKFPVQVTPPLPSPPVVMPSPVTLMPRGGVAVEKRVGGKEIGWDWGTFNRNI